MAGIRERARLETVAEIKRLARQQIAEVGASSLSLRQIARDIDLVSSALYRYFPSRDELFTALIVDAYNELGEVAEAAAARPAGSSIQRHSQIWRAVRSWAIATPSQWALIYGSPVPGYQAPVDTVGPATRVAAVLAAILDEAHRSGSLAVVPDTPVFNRTLAREGRALASTMGLSLPEGVLLRGVMTWVQLIGSISAELFGQLHNVVDASDAFFDYQVNAAALFVGLQPQ